jgi:hypothetical protein
VKEYQEINGFSPEKALREAISYAIKNGILTDIIKPNDEEVFKMFYEELSVKRQVAASLANGIDIGREETLMNVAKKMLLDPEIKINSIVKTTGFGIDELLRLKAELGV